MDNLFSVTAKLQSLSLIQQAIHNRLDEKATLQLIADEARQLTNASRCAVFLIEGEMLRIAVTSGQPAGGNSGIVIPLKGSLVEQAIARGELVRIDDTQGEKHIHGNAAREKLIEDLRIRSLLISPLLVEGDPIGAISLSDRVEGNFGEDEERVLHLMSFQAALAIENARLRQAVQQAAVTEERSRLARELHDSVTQSLYSLTLFTESARAMAQREGQEQLEKRVARIGEIAQQALKEMRLMVYELRPRELQEGGLISAVRGRLDAVEGRAGVKAYLEVDQELTLSSQLEQGFYRIIQEALNNIIKYSRASTVWVEISREEHNITLRVRDDGIGFEVDYVNDSGMGLHTMQERAEQLGGTLAIESTAGEGTSIVVQVEVTEEA